MMGTQQRVEPAVHHLTLLHDAPPESRLSDEAGLLENAARRRVPLENRCLETFEVETLEGTSHSDRWYLSKSDIVDSAEHRGAVARSRSATFDGAAESSEVGQSGHGALEES